MVSGPDIPHRPLPLRTLRIAQFNHYVVSFLRRLMALPNDYAGVDPKSGACLRVRGRGKHPEPHVVMCEPIYHLDYRCLCAHPP